MPENHQQISSESRQKLHLEELREEGKALTEQEMKQVTGGAGVGKLQGTAGINMNGKTIPTNKQLKF
ncbi:hypothetical protein D3P09_18440 [Paenibacillus pinisoli]|uniref:Uncharacterized protein n=1 Tax=Paenibacillus pinisoli TaxID=1276110 RepID=A0A3A6PEJ2_9BACL|nr:hypothetical protein [Paenibacillus pinisoli]RJX38056.1 hypothetical protein D3P09_18440 [Paenibacillus pinisoli]